MCELRCIASSNMVRVDDRSPWFHLSMSLEKRMTRGLQQETQYPLVGSLNRAKFVGVDRSWL